MSNTRIALVTGANQGIGFQVAKELVAHGWTVMVGARDSAKGQAAAGVIGAGAVFVPLDVTDAASIAAAADHIRAEHGRLDLLVNNAAISRPPNASDMTLADHMKTMSATTAKTPSRTVESRRGAIDSAVICSRVRTLASGCSGSKDCISRRMVEMSVRGSCWLRTARIIPR